MNLSSEQEYLELSEGDLRTLLQSDEITVPDEACVFDALMIWIKHDLETRKDLIGNLLFLTIFFITGHMVINGLTKSL